MVRPLPTTDLVDVDTRAGEIFLAMVVACRGNGPPPSAEDMHWLYGTLSGIPPCCVEFFSHHYIMVHPSRRQYYRVPLGIGYRPCPDCAAAILEEQTKFSLRV